MLAPGSHRAIEDNRVRHPPGSPPARTSQKISNTGTGNMKELLALFSEFNILGSNAKGSFSFFGERVRMMHHSKAELHIGRCFKDSLGVWIRHLVVLLFASSIAVVLSAATGTLLLGSLYAGLMMLLLNGMRGKTAQGCGCVLQGMRFSPVLCIYPVRLSAVGCWVGVFDYPWRVIRCVVLLHVPACRRSKFQAG